MGRTLIALIVSLAAAGSAFALDHVTLRRDGMTFEVEGRLVLTAQDGGILVMARDGVLWNILPGEQVKHTSDEVPFKPLIKEQMSRSLLAQLPAGFEAHQTAHYVIFHNTSRAYAQWCGSLFERLYGAFHTYWTYKGVELTEPEFPLTAVVFADKRSYLKFSKEELEDAGESIIGYFSLATNRMTMYDLTGASAPRNGRERTSAEINRVLSSPEAVRTVSTIVHEATHQIAFNCGLHTRYSDCPRWFSEGVAMYFETPDLRSPKGWSGVGVTNRPRLAQFQESLPARPRDSLKTLLAGDKRFLSTKNASDTYAEAWALTHFLLRQHSKEYVEYLKLLAKKEPLVQDGPEKRTEEFEKCFGDLKEVEAEFVKFMRRVR
jgi:hypothetical protein